MDTFNEEFGELWVPGEQVPIMRATKRKREWEDNTEDDLLTINGSLRHTPSSGGSYSTRRRKAARRNQESNARAEARLKARPEFQYIGVVDSGEFNRHYKPGLSFAPPDPLVVEFMEERGQEDLQQIMEGMCMMRPCDEAQMRHLKFFDRLPYHPARPADPALNRAIRFVTKILTLDNPIPFPHAEDLGDVRYKPNKFPGNEYKRLGFHNREEAQEVALLDAKLAWAKLMAGEHIAPHTVRLGGRGKLVMKSQAAVLAEGVPKGRLILMLSQRDLLLLGNVEQRLTEAYKDESYPMSIGFGWYGGNVTRMVNRLAGKVKYHCMDAEKFDASLDPWLVEECLRIVRIQMVDGLSPSYDKYWDFVRESLLEAPIARDDGWVMLKSVGTTSGHSFNTLLQSIASLILGFSGVLKNTPREKWGEVLEATEIETLGDDNETGVPDILENMTGRQYGQPVKELTGVNWLGDKSFSTDVLFDLNEFKAGDSEEGRFQGVQYLGKYLRLTSIPDELGGGEAVIPYRPFTETLARMYYPERDAHNVLHVYERALGNLLDAYGNPTSARWLNEFLDWLEPKLEFMPTIWMSDTVQDAARDYTSAEVVVPRPKRWTWEEWLVLTLGDVSDNEDLYIIA
ncbi:putative RNA-dependent RNA polymerase [Lichen RNA virus 1]|nr:putative RNA-dependent RNA polymerase [Lichen RNA virus 1]